MDKTALVTGCSTGIGRATAYAFLNDSWTVYATARDERSIRALAERGVDTAAVDVTSETEVDVLVDRMVEDAGRIDCLVNNAGYGQLGPVEDVPTERAVRQFDVNVFGPHRLIRAVLPHMRSRDSGRILNVSSAVDRFVLPGTGIYSASKFALRAMSDALRQELSETGIDVVVLEPWLVATDFFEAAVTEVRRLERTPSYRELYRLLESLERVDGDFPGVLEPREIARAVLRAATVEEPNAYYPVGPFAKLGLVVALLVTGRRRDYATRLGLDIFSRFSVTESLDRERRF